MTASSKKTHLGHSSLAYNSSDCNSSNTSANRSEQMFVNTPAEAVLEAKNVSFSYAHGKEVLANVSAQLAPGTFLAIIGRNGSGKSTLLNCLDAVLAPERGTVLLDGQNLAKINRTERARRIAYVPQHSHAHRVTVFDALLLGRRPFMTGAPSDADLDTVERVIGQLDLADLALSPIEELSGGEYQKVLIARAFVQDTDVLLLDEPTNNLDMANQHEVLHLVRRAVDGALGTTASADERGGTGGAAGTDGAAGTGGTADTDDTEGKSSTENEKDARAAGSMKGIEEARRPRRDKACSEHPSPDTDRRHIAAAAVLHDVNLALAYCDRFVALASGRVVAVGGREMITPSLIKQVFGVDAQIIEHDGRPIVVVYGFKATRR